MPLSRERQGQIALYLVRLARREANPLDLLHAQSASDSVWLSLPNIQREAGFPEARFTQSEIAEFLARNGGEKWHEGCGDDFAG